MEGPFEWSHVRTRVGCIELWGPRTSLSGEREDDVWNILRHHPKHSPPLYPGWPFSWRTLSPSTRWSPSPHCKGSADHAWESGHHDVAVAVKEPRFKHHRKRLGPNEKKLGQTAWAWSNDGERAVDRHWGRMEPPPPASKPSGFSVRLTSRANCEGPGERGGSHWLLKSSASRCKFPFS